jgi:hypothetical protein
VFRGSGRDQVMQALTAARSSPQEIAEIRSLLDDPEKKGAREEPPAGGDA